VLAKVPKDSSVYRASRQRIAMLDEQRGHHAFASASDGFSDTSVFATVIASA